MFCPNCKSEYIDGIATCRDCGIDLVDRLEEEFHPNTKLVNVFADVDLGSIAVVKSLLEEAGIPYFIQGEEGQNLLSLVTPYVVMVREEDQETVMEILKELEEPGTDSDSNSGEDEESE